MLSDQVRQELALFIEREARPYLSFRSSLFNLQKEIFTDLVTGRNNQLTELESAIEQFALIQIELSEGTFNNVYNGQLAAAIGIAVWQEKLLSTAMAICYRDGAFAKWSEGKAAEAGEIGSLAEEARRQQEASNLRNTDVALFHWENVFNQVRGMQHLRMKHLDRLYELSAIEKVDEQLTDFVFLLLELDVRVCFEMAALSLHLLSHATGGRAERMEQMADVLRTVEAGIAELGSVRGDS